MLRILRCRFWQVDRLRKYAEIGTAKVLYRGLAKIHILRQNAFDKAGKGVRIAADIIADNGCYYRRVVAARAQLWHNNIINIRENTYDSIKAPLNDREAEDGFPLDQRQENAFRRQFSSQNGIESANIRCEGGIIPKIKKGLEAKINKKLL